jgi:hypothetical protein
MTRPAVAVCMLLVLAAGGPAAAQTRSFFDAQCSYTRPGVEWEWVDTKAVQAGESARTLVVARNPSGLTFTLRYRPKDQRPDANSFGAFEENLLASGKYKKLGSRRLFFKGSVCYQVDVQTVLGEECSRIRLLFANDKAYLFSVTYSPGPLGPEEETDYIFRGFEFRPPDDRPAEGESETALGRLYDDVPTWVWVGLLVLLVGGIWTVVRIRARNNYYRRPY